MPFDERFEHAKSRSSGATSRLSESGACVVSRRKLESTHAWAAISNNCTVTGDLDSYSECFTEDDPIELGTRGVWASDSLKNKLTKWATLMYELFTQGKHNIFRN